MILYGEANKSTQTIVESDYKTPDWFNLPERRRFGTMAKANLAAQTPANFSVPVVYSSSLSRSGASLSFHKQLSKPHDVGSAETSVISGFSLPRCYILIAAAEAGILRRSATGRWKLRWLSAPSGLPERPSQSQERRKTSLLRPFVARSNTKYTTFSLRSIPVGIHRVTDRVTCWSGVGAIRLTSMGASSSELYSSPSIVLEYKDECVRSDVFSDWPVMNDTGCSPGGSFLC